ncbi:hypothetical protein [Paenibacillus sp. NRS-1760]|uniref:hypothetical protein n=1 Tax=Paenibacillus sp. NRS-1760 TaxID=3233902 RepID=UPI003D26B097
MTDNIIVIYDKLETDFSHFGLAVIRNTIDQGPRIFQRINADFTLNFLYHTPMKPFRILRR